ncbi:uncharacterized protein PgNI_03667 [Pyricularia grisea]|uniref:Uncharacterized protein n=1 Tax=Pyricularia grisea TaxID=148305 RepID=A0A6P8B8J0_PYRGI|nr:uncharacterized protein PgNI_03667 [Pyricularia grisea]TLD12106.1 hypothetical protein PgNI_03667 [Pyricularia grisea]
MKKNSEAQQGTTTSLLPRPTQTARSSSKTYHQWPPSSENEFPTDLRSCVSLLTHNLFDPHPFSAADIYILKWIL